MFWWFWGFAGSWICGFVILGFLGFIVSRLLGFWFCWCFADFYVCGFLCGCLCGICLVVSTCGSRLGLG